MNRACRHWFLLIPLVSGPLCGAFAAPNPNYLPNPGFETVGSNGLPDEWFCSVAQPETCKITVDTAVVHSGKRSFHITFNPAAEPKIAPELVIYDQAPGFHEPGKRYTYSMYVKTKGLAGGVSIEMIQAGTGVSTASTRLRGDNDWTRLTVTFTAAANKGETFSFLSARINVLGGPPGQLAGEVWLDSGKLEEGEAATEFVPEAEKVFYKRGGAKPWNYPIRYDHKVSLEVETPHAAPSRPSAWKRPSVLFAMIYTNLRVPVELAQRGEMSVDSIPVNGLPSQIYFEIIQRLHEKLNSNPDVVVMEVSVWNALIQKDRAEILDRVRAGMGLVVLPNTWPLADFANVLAAAAVVNDPAGKPVAPAPDVSVHALGTGRIVLASVPIQRDSNTFMREWNYDRLLRAIHAARGEIAASVSVKIEPAIPEAGQSWNVRCELPSTPQPAASVRMRLRPAREGSLPMVPVEVLHEQTLKAEADKTASFGMPPIAAGNYIVEVSALNSDGKVVAWTLKPCICDASLRIWSIETQTPRIPSDGRLQTTVRIENRQAQERALSLAAEVRDTEDRLLAVGGHKPITLKPGMNDIPVRFTVPAAVTPQVRLRAELFDHDTRLDSRTLPFSAEALLREPDFRFVYYHDFFEDGIRRLGADTSWTPQGLGSADVGMRAYLYLDAMPGQRANPNYLDASDSVTSDVTRAKMSRVMMEWCSANRPYRQVAMVIGDEWTHSFNPAQVPADTAYFHKFLRTMYGSVAKLNASWKTNLKSFDEVTLDMCSEEQVRSHGAEPARWADLRRMYEVAVAEYIRVIGDAARKADPDARLGFGGTYDTTSAGGNDWWLLMQSCESMASYGYVHAAVQRSFASERTRFYQPSYVWGDWIERARHDPWRDVLLQRDGYLHYGGRFSEIFLPDYSMYSVGKAIGEEVAAIRSGPARLIRISKTEDHGIGILYSIASYHASSLPAIYKTGPDVMNDILTSVDAALSDASLNARFWSYEQLARGDVRPGTVKALILPYSIAMSASEVAAVRRYVQSGGVLVADLRPAVFDKHCHTLKTGALDDVFGVEPVGKGNVLKPATLTAGKEVPDLAAVPGLAGEWDLRLKDGAVALGSIRGEGKSAPAIVEHRFGRGRAILLNCAFPDYSKMIEAGIAGEESVRVQAAEIRPVRQYWAALLERAAAIRPVVRLVDPKTKEDLGSILLRTYRDGAISYFGFLQHLEDERLKREARMIVHIPGEVYDVRAGTYLGKAGDLPIVVEAAKARLFSVLPYKVKRVSLRSPARVSLGAGLDFTTQVETERGRAGRHVVVVRLTRPDGSSKEWDRFTLLAPEGKTAGSYRFALNDPTGRWTLTATDAATGVSSSVAIEVTP